MIHQENQGVSAARNLALDLVRGTYVLFFDGDDYVLPETLRELYEKAEKEEADSILYGYYLVENGRITETHLPGFAKDVYQGEEILEQVVPKFVGVSYGDIDRWLSGDRDALKKENTALWRSMIRTEVLKRSRIRFDQTLKVGEDTCFTTEYLSCTRYLRVVWSSSVITIWWFGTVRRSLPIKVIPSRWRREKPAC